MCEGEGRTCDGKGRGIEIDEEWEGGGIEMD
jgi:hypothetical protein